MKTLVYRKLSEEEQKSMDSKSDETLDKMIHEDIQERFDLKPGDIIDWYGTKYRIHKSLMEDIRAMKIPGKVVCMIPLPTESYLDVAELWIPKENNKNSYSITTISQMTGLSRNTVYRICRYLVYHGAIIRKADLEYTGTATYFFYQLDFKPN